MSFPKYKVGDKVRLNKTWSDVKQDTIHEIVAIDKNTSDEVIYELFPGKNPEFRGNSFLNNRHNDNYFHPYHFTLVDENNDALFSADQIRKAVFDFPQGCEDQKRAFLKTLGISTKRPFTCFVAITIEEETTHDAAKQFLDHFDGIVSDEGEFSVMVAEKNATVTELLDTHTVDV